MAKCPTCGAPVNLAPDGDPKYEPRRSWRETFRSKDVKLKPGWLKRQVELAVARAAQYPLWLTRRSPDEPSK